MALGNLNKIIKPHGAISDRLHLEQHRQRSLDHADELVREVQLCFLERMRDKPSPTKCGLHTQTECG